MSRIRPTSGAGSGTDVRGVLLVAGAALVWSFGGMIVRFLEVGDSWTIVFWRSLFAVLFLLVFMLARDGPRGTVALFRGMGWPGLGVAICFCTGSTAFIVALAHTTVANILLIQAGAPLIAALLTWTLFRERIAGATWAAIAAVIAGVAIMVSDSLAEKVSFVGDGLAVLNVVVYASAIVITRRHAHIRMTPAVCFAMMLAVGISAGLAGGLAVGPADLALLFAFGALNLGLGLALFVTGTRLLAAAVTALIGTLEPVLGPLWVWLSHGEEPGTRTLAGGSVVVAALFAHLLVEWWHQKRAAVRAAPTLVPPGT